MNVVCRGKIITRIQDKGTLQEVLLRCMLEFTSVVDCSCTFLH